MYMYMKFDDEQLSHGVHDIIMNVTPYIGGYVTSLMSACSANYLLPLADSLLSKLVFGY